MFDCNELWEYNAWVEHYKANDYSALAFALDIHRGWSLQASDVSDYLRPVPLRFCGFLLMSFHLRQLK